MSRTTSTTFREAVYTQETEQVYTILLTISHEDLAVPIYVSTDNADQFVVESQTVRGTISNGINYLFCPLEITLPDDPEGGIPSATISIDNVDRTLTDTLRSIVTPPSVSIQVVLASDPDIIEAQFDNFILNSVDYNSLTVTGGLTLDNFFGEPYPADSFLPSNFPGIF